jgi:hypothetical protein
MTDLAVPMFIVTIFMTPVVWGLKALFLSMLSSREPDVYERLGSPNLSTNRNIALAQLGLFLYSRQPEQLFDRLVYTIANVLRVLIPLYVATAIPLLYRLFLETRAA